ncbi:MAG: hypothetical protein NVS1B7_7250 [Candidatus Saccharimonadales bacterium]
MLAVVAAGAIIIDSRLQRTQANTPTNRTVETKTSYYPSDQIFRTAYFQMQAPKSWIAIPDASTANKFVYRSMTKTLVEQEFDVLVNAPALNERVTRDVAVEVKGNSLIPKKISEPCGKTLPKSDIDRSPHLVTVNGIQIMCVPDSNEFNVIVGTESGNTTVVMQRPGTSTAQYQFFYRNVTVSPDPRDLIAILETFQTR